ncbi:glucose-6-phosphate dehydrogenase, partial [Candidatus Dojkabacteria bacterium]|nr:glucose-6-phosphate dehydrogenase [Candidatus Dojkabacteria bacterium]
MKNINLPTTLVIFGATGDLTRRKLLPALYNLDQQSMLPEQIRIIAFARKELDQKQYKQYIESHVADLYPNLIEDTTWNKFFEKIDYISGDFADDKSYQILSKKLDEVDMHIGVCTHKLFYLAVSPDLYENVLQGIVHTELNAFCKNINDTRVILEKPFGKDYASFEKLNKQITDIFDEKQIYRIDHFLGKETVQNLLYFRAANPIFSNDWNKHKISKVYVRAYESIGIEKRADYYDKYGQLRDMVQSHLLQLLALVLMDMPSSLDDMEGINQRKAEVLEKLTISDKSKIVRGQYMEGVVDAIAVGGYREEDGIDLSSNTETFVKVSA